MEVKNLNLYLCETGYYPSLNMARCMNYTMQQMVTTGDGKPTQQHTEFHGISQTILIHVLTSGKE